MGEKHFRALDGWRGVCAICVALFHFHVLSHVWSLPFVQNSWLMVDFFFVLSGFVITHSYGQRLGDWPSVKNFAIRRLGRLYPLHLATLAAMVLLETGRLAARHFHLAHAAQAPFTGPNSRAALVANLFLAHSLGAFPEATWNGPSWSISGEFYTYLLFAMLCVAAPARHRRSAIFLGAAAALIVGGFSPALFNTPYDYSILRCICGFMTGSATYSLWRHSRRWQARFGAAASTGLEIAILAAILCYVWFVPDFGSAVGAPLLFGCAILVFAHERGRISGLLKTRIFEVLGAISYSLYMVHHFVILLFLSFAARWIKMGSGPAIDGMAPVRIYNSMAGDAVILVYLCTIVALSLLTYRWIEQPGRAFFNRFATRDSLAGQAARGQAEIGVHSH